MDIPSTITEQIANVKDLDISYRMLHNSAYLLDITTNKTIEIPFESLVNKYRDTLDKITINIEFDDRLSRQYLYNPKLLSNDLYKTTELWAELLRLNNFSSITEFKPVKLKIYDPTKLKSFLNEILILEGKL